MDQAYASIAPGRGPDRGGEAQQGSRHRHDLYGHVHMGLRALMGEVLAAVGRMDVEDARSVGATILRFNALMALLRSHMSHEDRFILPALEARRPGAGESNARDHAQHAQLIELLEACARRVQVGTGPVRAEAARELYRKLALFVAENLIHMQAEEADNNAVLWAAYTDGELAALESALVASLALHKLVDFLREMVPAVPPAERARMLQGIGQSVPPATFEIVLAAVRPRLTERDWLKLSAALDRRPVAAEAA